MNSTYGEKLKLSIFGQSHGKAIGMTLDGIPGGLPVDELKLLCFLTRRAPGRHAYDTPRKEADTPEFLSGIVGGFTCGAPITAVIYNTNTRSEDYDNLKDCPRPGHSDYTAQMKYGGYQDAAGGGHFSGRLTAPLCIAGGLCKQWLEQKGIEIAARILSIGNIMDEDVLDRCNPDFSKIHEDFPVLNSDTGDKMKTAIAQAKADGDSLGGVIECMITGMPVGIGGPLFAGLEGKIAQIIYAIPAVKGIEFGSGFSGSFSRGSQNNDPFTVSDGRIVTTTNNAGGILGGISTGMPIVFRTAFKPTPSIAMEQDTVRLSTMEPVKLRIQGRHDPCIVPRAVPVVEAAAAIAVYDAIINA